MATVEELCDLVINNIEELIEIITGDTITSSSDVTDLMNKVLYIKSSSFTDLENAVKKDLVA